MNERIKELAKEAGYKHPEAVGSCEDYAYFDHEKFAELIVRECIFAVEDAGGINKYHYTTAISKHFGVEE